MLAMVCCLALVSCGEESLDYNHRMWLFVKLKTENNSALRAEQCAIAKRNIEELLKYAEFKVIPSFPLAPVSYSAGGKLRLGECILWTVETVRLGHNASMGYKMCNVDAENWRGICF